MATRLDMTEGKPTCSRSDFIVSKDENPTYGLSFCNTDAESIMVETRMAKKHGRKWVLKEISDDGKYKFSPVLGNPEFIFVTKSPENNFCMW
jgi:hypothetical protein